MCQFSDTCYSCGCLETRTWTYCGASAKGQTCVPEENQCWTLSENCADCQADIDAEAADAEMSEWIEVVGGGDA